MNKYEKKYFLFFSFIFLIQCLSFAQDYKEAYKKRPLNNININFFGNASIGSVNFERLTVIKSNFIIAGQFGIGVNEEFEICLFGECDNAEENYTTFPFQITGNIGVDRHFLEMGFGSTLIVGESGKDRTSYVIIGYRFLPSTSKRVSFNFYTNIQLRGGIDAMIATPVGNKSVLFIPFGLKIGVSI